MIVIHKMKTILILKSAYFAKFMQKLNKLSIHEFLYGYIKNKYSNKSRSLFRDIDSLAYEMETQNVYDDFSKGKEMFGISNYSTEPKYYNDSNALLFGKIENEMLSISLSIEIFF